MSGFSASSAPRSLTISARHVGLTALALLLAATFGTAGARSTQRDSLTRVSSTAIDVGNVHLKKTLSVDKNMHLKGDLTINGKHVALDDTFALNMPKLKVAARVLNGHSSGPNIDLGPGIRIESDDASIVRMGSDIEIDSTENVEDDVVALFGNVTVHGHVGGDVVAVLGSVTLEPGAVVEGDAVAIGGSLDQANDATVHGKSVSLSFLPIRRGMPALRALAVAVFALWMVGMLLGGLLLLVFPRRLTVIAETVSERTGWSLLFGLLLPPLAVIAAVLLIVTVIGIPIAVLLPLTYLFTLWCGTIASTYLLGTRLMRRPIGGGQVAPLFAGTLMLGVLFGFGAAFAGKPGMLGTLALFFPLLGLLLALSLAVIGSGAVLVSRFGSAPKGAADAPDAGAGATPTQTVVGATPQ